ncbi:MAG TPA: HEAT repeat domain-containing protein, partial [Candidatus Ozemobacteraceae bacterium]|nr:HEAT repeat domain-containing protein [Candidatus Ozemobacteraceae bacterium]
LELLRSQDPMRFRETISAVIGGASPEVRYHALRLLRSVDMDAALECLRECVRDAEPVSRLKAVRELTLIPFEHTEVLLLDVMGCESRTLILVAASICVAMNPSPELPVKLYDMFALARGEKQQILKMLLHLCVNTLKESGLLKVGVQEYLAHLQQQIQVRKHELQKRFMMRDLSDVDPDTRLTAMRWLQDYIEDPEVLSACRERQSVETDPDCRLLLKTMLDSMAPSVAVPGETTVPPSPPTPQQELQEMQQRLKGGGPMGQERNRLRDLFEREEQKSLQIQVVRLSARYGETEDVPWLRALLGHQNPAVVAEAIRGVGRLDLDTLLHTMNRWLTHADPRIRKAGLEVYLQHDKEQALGYIRHMIDSPQPVGRKAAIALLMMLDYATAEPFLVRMYAQEPRSGLRDQVAAILSTNPSMHGLLALFDGTHDSGGELLDEEEGVWATALANAEKVMKRPAVALEQECARRHTQQREAWRAATAKAV